MTKTRTRSVKAANTPSREPRAFSYLKPQVRGAEPPVIDQGGRAVLAARVGERVPALVRALIDHTISLQNRRALEAGFARPISMSVLNRRRRVARSWIQAVVGGLADVPTLHAVATQWLPTLAGNTPDTQRLLETAQSCVEFLRGAMTALLFEHPTENLLANARALHVLELVLASHLAATQEVAAQRV